SSSPRRQILEAGVERGELGIVRLGDVHAERVVQRDDEIQHVHRVEIELVAKRQILPQRGQVGLGGDVAEGPEHRGAQLLRHHSRSGDWRRRSTAARNSPPRWPSLTRWSADSVAVTTGRGPIAPSTTHGRSTMRPNPTMATWGGYTMPRTLSTPCSPRLVTVIVASDSSELRRPPPRARWTRSRKAPISAPSGRPSTSCSAGAIRPPPRSATATPT